jgi:PAS domain S-box-containing protein
MRMEGKYIKSGIETIGDIYWGAHMCQFYRTKDDLIDILVPYFKAGLENNEFCLWVTSKPLGAEEAKAALGKVVRDLDDYISKGQIEILDYSELYITVGKFKADEELHGWIRKEMEALEKGFNGFRLTGNTSWLGAEDWVAFRDYEATLDSIIGEHQMIVMCTYSLEKCGASEILDVMNNHETTLIKRKSVWKTVESDERKRLKKILSGSEVRFRRLFETAQDGILILNADTGHITDVNPFLKDMLGFTTEELLGKKLWEIGLFNDIAKSEDAFKALLMEGYIRYEDLRLETKDSKPIDVEFISNVYDVDHRKIIQCNIRDIRKRRSEEQVAVQYKDQLEKLVNQRTGELEDANIKLRQELIEHKKSEEALKESEERFRLITENSPDPIIETDVSGNIVYASPSIKRISGRDPKEVVGSNLTDILPLTSIPIVQGVFKQAAKETIVVKAELDLLSKDGGLIPVEVSIAPVVKSKGTSGFIGIARDMTDRKKAEEDRRRAAKLESIGTLAGGIAHDFNNILTGILGNIQLAILYLKQNKSDTAQEVLGEAELVSLRAKDLTQQLLTFSKGGAPIKKVALINKLIKEAGIFALRGSKVKPEFTIAEDLWAVDVDEGQLNQVINNLVINADQVMPNGGIINISASNIVVGANQTLPLPEGNYIEIDIKDHGIGISKENKDKIFDPYFTTKPKGVGLGLATSYSIIKNHGGDIVFESELGVGTTFRIYLPATKEEPKKEVKKAVGIQPLPLAHGRILVMDDEETILMLLGRMLKGVGYEVELTKDGVEAIQKYTEAKKSGKPFDVVILDLTVPGGIGGRDVIAKLLEIDPGVKAIVSSGYANDPIMAEFKKYGFSGVVTKPYNLGQMQETLRDILADK